MVLLIIGEFVPRQLETAGWAGFFVYNWLSNTLTFTPAIHKNYGLNTPTHNSKGLE